MQKKTLRTLLMLVYSSLSVLTYSPDCWAPPKHNAPTAYGDENFRTLATALRACEATWNSPQEGRTDGHRRVLSEPLVLPEEIERIKRMHPSARRVKTDTTGSVLGFFCCSSKECLSWCFACDDIAKAMTRQFFTDYARAHAIPGADVHSPTSMYLHRGEEVVKAAAVVAGRAATTVAGVPTAVANAVDAAAAVAGRVASTVAGAPTVAVVPRAPNN